ncbi:MAG: hypothetical protein FWC26_05480 [Fibromonadales bacterium]|nr:hypothetical protein [Fibromonadales bacterium]
MHYLDFSSLLVLAIGCNLIYIVNKNKSANLSFFLFLYLINNTKETIKKLNDNYIYATVILSKLKELMQKPVTEIEKIYGKKNSDYILNNRNIEYPASMRKKYESIIFFFTGTDKLQSITLVTFCYSFFVALLAPYKLELFNELLFQMNITILLLSVTMFIYGILAKRKLKMLLFDAILAIIIVILSIIVKITIDDFVASIINEYNDVLYYNYVITILICFIGFILYTILHMIGFVISLYYRYKPNRKFSKLKKIFEGNKEQSKSLLLEEPMDINMDR